MYVCMNESYMNAANSRTHLLTVLLTGFHLFKVVHQFKTVSACVSVTWHLKHHLYYKTEDGCPLIAMDSAHLSALHTPSLPLLSSSTAVADHRPLIEIKNGNDVADSTQTSALKPKKPRTMKDFLAAIEGTEKYTNKNTNIFIYIYIYVCMYVGERMTNSQSFLECLHKLYT